MLEKIQKSQALIVTKYLPNYNERQTKNIQIDGLESPMIAGLLRVYYRIKFR